MALGALESSLEVFTHESYPQQWATAKLNLGVMYRRRVKGARLRNIEYAIQALEDTLKVRTREALPMEWAAVQHNLGLAYYDRQDGDRSQNMQRSIAAMQAALEVFRPDNLPLDAQRVALHLGWTEFHEGRWERAYEAFKIAIEASEKLYTTAVTDESKSGEIEEHSIIYRYMIETCLRMVPPRLVEAFLYAEQGRSRLLRDQIDALSLPAPPQVPNALLLQEVALLQTTRNLRQALDRFGGNEAERRALVDRAIEVRSQLEGLWETLIKDHEAFDYVGLRRGEKLEWEDIQRWLAEQGRRVALLEFFGLSDGIASFIVREGDAVPYVTKLGISQEELTNYFERFVAEIHGFDPEHPSTETWQEMAPKLLSDLMPHLESAEVVYLIPHGLLHYFPIHALMLEGKPFIERYSVVYVPSVSIMLRISRISSLLRQKERRMADSP